jgi:hypothetical protein
MCMFSIDPVHISRAAPFLTAARHRRAYASS